jgi:hypothetical protein
MSRERLFVHCDAKDQSSACFISRSQTMMASQFAAGLSAFAAYLFTALHVFISDKLKTA